MTPVACCCSGGMQLQTTFTVLVTATAWAEHPRRLSYLTESTVVETPLLFLLHIVLDFK
jgi:hypothetical protein